MIRELKLRNVGPHQELDLSFSPGVTGVIGPNGAGKSYILAAIAALLTDDFSAVPGAADSRLIHLASPPESPAYYSGVFDIRGETIRVVRGLRGKRSSLRIGNGQEITGATKIKDALALFFGVDASALGASLFVRQGSLSSIVTMRPAERLQLLQSLLSLSRCEKVHEVVSRRADVDEAVAREKMASNVEEKELEAAAKVVDDLRASFAAAELETVPDSVADEWQRSCDAIIAHNAAVAERKECEAKLGNATSVAAKADSVRRAAEAELKRLSDLLESGRPAVEEAKARLAAQANHNKVAEARKSVQARIAAADAAIAKCKAAWVPFTEDDAEALRDLKRQREEFRLKQAQNNTFLSHFHGGETTCPTCGTEMPDCQARLAEAKEVDAWCDRRLYDINIAVEKLEARDAAATRSANELSTLTSRKQESVSLLERMPESEPLDASAMAMASAVVAKYGANESAKVAANTALMRATVASTTASAQLDALQKRLAKLPLGDPQDVGEFRELLAIHAKHKENLAAIGGQLRSATAELERRRAAAESAKKRWQEGMRHARRAAVLRNVAEQFHRKNMPSVVMRRELASLSSHVNGWLERFAAPFYAVFRDDLTFNIQRNDGTEHPAAMASGAQKDILGLAFWLSIPAPSPILLLDEPTAHLDEANRGRLGAVFRRLAASFAGERQVIVTTHADDLSSSFDQVIALER